MLKYVIIEANDAIALQQQVNLLLTNGYKLYGQLIITTTQSPVPTMLYTQAMTNEI